MLALTEPASQPSMASVVVATHDTLLAIGLLIAVIWTVKLIRSGLWRQPLAAVRCTGEGPSLAQLLVVIGTYLLLQNVGVALSLRGVDRALVSTPGSDASLSLTTIDGAAKLLACVLIILFLARVRSFAPATAHSPRPEPLRLGRMILLALAAMWFILPVVTLQLNMGQVLWQLIQPDTPPPVHPTFESMANSEWGAVGVVQLFVMAIVVAPITEELFFRGILLQTIGRYTRGVWIAIALSAAAFGLVHYGQPQAVLPLATMGLILGYVRVRYRSIELCILIHALFNAQSMVSAFLAPELV